MRWSSVFVFMILLASCSETDPYSMDELVGQYETVGTEEESWFDPDSWFSKASGWDYDFTENYNLTLFPDSTYDLDCISAGAFECVDDYWGRWKTGHDTVYLTPEGGLVYVGLELVRQAPSMLPPDILAPTTERVLIIQSDCFLVPVATDDYAFARMKN